MVTCRSRHCLRGLSQRRQGFPCLGFVALAATASLGCEEEPADKREYVLALSQDAEAPLVQPEKEPTGLDAAVSGVSEAGARSMESNAPTGPSLSSTRSSSPPMDSVSSASSTIQWTSQILPIDETGRDISSSFPPPNLENLDAGGCVSCSADVGPPPETDSDQDGLADDEDGDDDDDGIVDSVDDEPLVPTIVPGAPNPYPGGLLTDPCVVKALREYAELRSRTPGLPELVLHREHLLPDLTGFYRAPYGTGRLIAGNDNPALGFIQGFEFKFTRLGEDWYQIGGVAYDGGRLHSHWQTAPHVHRGTTTHFSRYTRDPGSVNITSGALTPELDEIDMVVINVTVSVDGTYADKTCPYDYWRVFALDLFDFVSPDEVQFMCKQEGTAYVPGEVWSAGDGGVCNCESPTTAVCE